MKPNKLAIIKPQGIATPTPMATELLEGAGWEVRTDEIAVLVVEEEAATELGGGSTVVKVVVIKVVEEDVLEVTVTAPITPIVVRTEGVPTYLVRALHNVEGLNNSIPGNSNTLNWAPQLTLLSPESMQ
jgi:hypothetical protein